MKEAPWSRKSHICLEAKTNAVSLNKQADDPLYRQTARQTNKHSISINHGQLSGNLYTNLHIFMCMEVKIYMNDLIYILLMYSIVLHCI